MKSIKLLLASICLLSAGLISAEILRVKNESGKRYFIAGNFIGRDIEDAVEREGKGKPSHWFEPNDESYWDMPYRPGYHLYIVTSQGFYSIYSSGYTGKGKLTLYSLNLNASDVLTGATELSSIPIESNAIYSAIINANGSVSIKSEKMKSEKKQEQAGQQKPFEKPFVSPLAKYYEILGLEEGASQEEIRKAYKELTLKWHPDKNPQNRAAATEMFKKISDAYDKLKSK